MCDATANQATQAPRQRYQQKDVEDKMSNTSKTYKTCLLERRDQFKVDTWQKLWKALFPGDNDIPSHRT